MSLGLKVVKGMKDILPEEIPNWTYVESKLKSLFLSYGYAEIRMPLVEQSELFKRAIGEGTDIVEKEMYTFEDKGGEFLTLRPEGTAQCVRAVLENSLTRNQSQRLWYHGAMFRRENPQKGRYRQFYQFGVEALGLAGPEVDAEQILMISRLWRQLGLSDKIKLQLNSLGLASERAQYRKELVNYFANKELDADSQRRLQTNPLRILDSKNPQMQDIIKAAPVLIDYLGPESLAHFERLQTILKENQIQFELNPRLVRGLDYYTHTVYEWVTTELGAQGTVCAGGRYNDLVTQIGGPATPGIGFALGVDRVLMLLVDNQLIPAQSTIDVYCIAASEFEHKALGLAETLRDRFPTLRLLTNSGGGSFKSQFKRADKCGAQLALVLGEQEIQTHTIGIKNLRDNSEQQTMTLEQAVEYLRTQLTLSS